MSPFAPSPVVDASPEEDPGGRPRRRRIGRRGLWISGALLLCAVLAVLGWRLSSDDKPALTQADVDKAVQRGIEQSEQKQRNTPPDATLAYRAISPSLVTVTTQSSSDDGPSAGGALGAGVVINAEGAVLTALHVVDGGGEITVRFADGTRAPARVASREAENDIAVLAVGRLPEVVVPAVMAGAPEVGADVFAVGNPLGLQASLSAGVVSANERPVRTRGGRTLDDLIQFDAAVNPGNSGGPLLNRNGQVVGIVTGLANPTRQAYFVGIGFAVPIATAGGLAGGPQQ